MIDQNRDGFIDHDDLKDMLASLGNISLHSKCCVSIVPHLLQVKSPMM